MLYLIRALDEFIRRTIKFLINIQSQANLNEIITYGTRNKNYSHVAFTDDDPDSFTSDKY